MSGVTDFTRGLGIGHGNARSNTKSFKAGNLAKGFLTRWLPAAGAAWAVGEAGSAVSNRFDKLESDVSDYEEKWHKFLGHTGAPTQDDFKGDDAEEDFDRYYREYWDTRPLDMDWIR